MNYLITATSTEINASTTQHIYDVGFIEPILYTFIIGFLITLMLISTKVTYSELNKKWWK